MAFIQCNFFSETLGMSCAMNVILPQETVRQIGMQEHTRKGRYPTLWLLHGASDDHTIWMRRTSIERYASKLGIAVVMPCVHLSWYADMEKGLPYFSFIAEELPRLCRQFFPLSERREDNFIAGLSMGGYGAFLHALRNPQNFAAAASLSGALDLAGYIDFRQAESGRMRNDFNLAFGSAEAVRGSKADLLAVASEAKKAGTPLPELYACCGTEDFLYDSNQSFRAHLAKESIPLTYEEAPGAHDWEFWDTWIQRVLEWLPLHKETAAQ